MAQSKKQLQSVHSLKNIIKENNQILVDLKKIEGITDGKVGQSVKQIGKNNSSQLTISTLASHNSKMLSQQINQNENNKYRHSKQQSVQSVTISENQTRPQTATNFQGNKHMRNQSVQEILYEANKGIISTENIDDFDQQQNQYQKFKKKYIKAVFDKDGNYLFSKMNEKVKPFSRIAIKLLEEEQQQLKQSLVNRREQFTSQNLEIKLQEIQKNIESDQKINDNQKGIWKRNLLKQKEKSLKALSEKFNQDQIENLIKSSKQQIENFYQETQAIIDQYEQKHLESVQDIKKQNILIMDQQVTVEELQNKNKFFNDCLEISKKQNISLMEQQQKFQNYVESYDQLNNKYPTFSLEEIVKNYDQVMSECSRLVRDRNEADEEWKEKLKQIQKERNLDDTKKLDLQEKIQKYREDGRAMTLELNELKMQNDVKFYKDQYIVLFNKVFELFLHWQHNFKVFDLVKEPKVELKDPIEIIDILKKQVTISTTQKAQEYIRKIIVGFNIMYKNFFPGTKINKFDHDQMFQQITKKYISLKEKYNKISNEKI